MLKLGENKIIYDSYKYILRLFMQRYTRKTIENKRCFLWLKFIKKRDNIYIVKILVYRGLREQDSQFDYINKGYKM